MTIKNCIALSALLLCTNGSPVQARVGGDLSTFSRGTIAKAFFFKDQSSKGSSTYMHYALIGDPQRQKASPGFGGGITLTVKSGLVTGETLLVVLGENKQIGKALAAFLAVNVAYDGIGKTPPTIKSVNEAETKTYYRAVESALNGSPQTIRYRGFRNKITIFAKDRNLLVTITPDQTASAQ